VVADDFGVGWFGCIIMESLSCNTLVITCVKNDDMLNILCSNFINAACYSHLIAQQLDVLYKL
jgi:hypothetical protein